MTRVVIVGEIYNADLSIGGGPVYPPPSGGHPAHPIYNPAYPAHPIYNPPPGYWGGVAPPYPDQGLPGSQPRPDQGLPPYPDQGLPPGSGGSPAHPIYNPAYPAHPIYNPPPGIWGGPPLYPDQGLPGPQPGSGGTPVPEDVYTPAPIPEEIASQYVVSTYNPKTASWTTKSYPPR